MTTVEAMKLNRVEKGERHSRTVHLEIADAAAIPAVAEVFDAVFHFGVLHHVPDSRTHHRGAVIMTDDALSRAGDPRLRTFAYSVGHAQSGQIRWMDALLTTHLPANPTTALGRAMTQQLDLHVANLSRHTFARLDSRCGNTSTAQPSSRP